MAYPHDRPTASGSAPALPLEPTSSTPADPQDRGLSILDLARLARELHPRRRKGAR